MATVDLHAIIPRDAQPALGVRMPEQMLYRIAQLASHKVTGDRQVYVWAATQQGIDEFMRDYPNADVKKNKGRIRGERSEWNIEMFPGSDDGIKDPHEIFLSGLTTLLRSDADKAARKVHDRDVEDAREKIRKEPIQKVPADVVATPSGGKKDK